MSSQVAHWRTASTFRPQLIITTTSPGAVMTAMRSEFERAGFKVIDSSPTYVRLRYIDWFAMAAQAWARTVVGLTQHPDGVLIAVEAGSEKRKAGTKGHEALNAAVAALTTQGVPIQVGAWHRAE